MQLQVVEIVFAELGFHALFGPVRWDGREPEEAAQLRFEDRGGIETGYRVDASFEFRCRDDLEIVARGHGQEVFLFGEIARVAQILFHVVHVAGGGGMALRDVVQHFSDNLILARVAGQIRVVFVVWKPFGVERQRHFEHLRSDGFQAGFGVREHLIDGAIGGEREAEFLGVFLRPEAPVDFENRGISTVGAATATSSALHILRQKAAESSQGIEGRGGGCVVGRFERCGDGCSQGFIDEADVAVIFFNRDLNP